MWHASVAAMGRTRSLFVDEVSDSTRRLLVCTAKRLIADVGQLPSAVEQFDLAMHYRRALTDEEYARLSPAWRAIPAVHEAGRGLILEANT